MKYHCNQQIGRSKDTEIYKSIIIKIKDINQNKIQHSSDYVKYKIKCLKMIS